MTSQTVLTVEVKEDSIAAPAGLVVLGYDVSVSGRNKAMYVLML